MSGPGAAPFGIVYDIQALQNPLHRDRGIGRYVTDHVDALFAAGAPLQALVLNPNAAPPPLPSRWVERGVVRWNTPATLREVRRDAERLVYHVGSPFEPAVPESGVVVEPALDAADVLSVLVFDTIPFVFPEVHQPTAELQSFFRRRARLVGCADVVLAISEHTRSDAISTFGLDPRRVRTQGTGGSPFFVPATDRSPTTVAGRYLLTVSGWGDSRKDPTTTFRAFAALAPELRTDLTLVVVCNLPPEGRAAWTQEIRDLGLTPDDVVFTGHIDDEELRTLYSHAEVFIASSRYEGFGLPVLEAARCGAAVLTTNVSSLPEVLDHPAATFAPDDHVHLASLIARALTDEPFHSDLLAASARAVTTHTWDRVAATSLVAWEHALQQVPPSVHPTRAAALDSLRLAVAGPFPPSKSGIGTFNARVATELAATARIDWFTEGDDVMPPKPATRTTAHRQFPIGAYGRTVNPGAYDATLFTIGNGHYHRATLAAAQRHAGIVWLHDAHLAGLHLTAAGLFLPGVETTPSTIEAARAHMRTLVRDLYGITTELTDDNWWRTETYDQLGLPLLRPVLDNARSLVVNTNAAATIARSEAPDHLDVHVLPLPFPTFAGVPRQRHELPAEPLVVSLGWVDPVKRPHDLIRAVARARVATGLPVRLAFVGELGPDTRHDLESVAADAGIRDAVEFTGFTTDEQYDDWLDRADLAVQLRTTTRGEASAALCDAIARGIPTITTITTASDLPSGVVRLLDATCDEGAVADAIVELLGSPEAREHLSVTALRHAATWTFADLARAVVTIVEQLPAPPIASRP